MKKLMIVLLVLFVFTIPAYAQIGMMGSQQGQMGQGIMQGGQPMIGQVMMETARERMGYHRRWFQYGVTLMLQNADKLKLSDEQIKKLDNIKRKYSKDIIKQDAEMKIAEIDLGALLKESEINLSEVNGALKKVENIKTQIRYLRIMAFVEARKILTDEQKNSLKKLMEMRGAPWMKGMTSSPEHEEGEEETPEEEAPKTDPYGH
jgi:Spy/CpxP family protein refolding chaperone